MEAQSSQHSWGITKLLTEVAFKSLLIFSLIFRGKVIDACCLKKGQGQNSKYTVKSMFPLNLILPLPISEATLLISFLYLSKIICAYEFREELYVTLKNTTCNIPWMTFCTLLFYTTF